MPKILIVGGGYAGFYTAWKLEKWLRAGEAEVTIVDPLPYMTYQPFLPEVAAGSIEPRHAVVALRRHLKKTNVVTAKVTGVDHASRTATITPEVGDAWTMQYDQIVMTAGAVSRTFPIPGVADEGVQALHAGGHAARTDAVDLVDVLDRLAIGQVGLVRRAVLLGDVGVLEQGCQLGHDLVGLEGADRGGGRGVAQVVQRRERGAVRQPGLRGHDGGVATDAACRDPDDVASRSAELRRHDLDVVFGGRVEGRGRHGYVSLPESRVTSYFVSPVPETSGATSCSVVRSVSPEVSTDESIACTQSTFGVCTVELTGVPESVVGVDSAFRFSLPITR